MAGRVLVVDDEESILITMKAVLEQANYAVATASTGAVAAHLLQEATFDVALVDLRLDDMDGLEIVALLRQHSPETVPIVLTGYASLDTAVGALRRGAYDYLTKPCDTEELKATVARAVERRRLGLQLAHHVRELEAANTTIRAQNAELEQRVDEATAALQAEIGEQYMRETSRDDAHLAIYSPHFCGMGLATLIFNMHTQNARFHGPFGNLGGGHRTNQGPVIRDLSPVPGFRCGVWIGDRGPLEQWGVGPFGE